MNENFKNKFKGNIGLNFATITYAIVLFVAVLNYERIFNYGLTLYGYVSPFFVAIAIAFILNLPMRFIENKILKKLKISSGKKRALSITLTFIFVFSLFGVIISFVYPQVVDSIATISSSASQNADELQVWLVNLVTRFEIPAEVITFLEDKLQEIIAFVTSLLSEIVPFIYNVSIGFASSTINMLMSFILSIYMLSSKESLIIGMKKVLYAVFSMKIADRVVEIGRLANNIFGKFIGGQLTEALILGSLTTIGMMILRLDYAFLIGTLIGVFSVIPIFGAFIGAAPGVIILLLVNPVEALIFVIFLVILQQFEGNVIYPRVVGGSIGISGLWLLFAILLGGGLGGPLGILIGIPTFAVIFTLVKEWANNTNKAKNVPKNKLN